MRKALTLLTIIALMSGCSVVQIKGTKTQKEAVPGSGLFKSTSRGEQWSLNGDLYSTDGKTRKLQYGDVTFIKFDPQDPQTAYLGTTEGIYYTYNGGAGWFATLSGKGKVNDITIDPDDKCTLFAAVHDKIFKSTDCARTWELTHLTSVSGQYFTAVLISRANSNDIFVGTSTGAIAQSRNGGVSWEIIKYFDTPISRFLEHPNQLHSWFIVTQKFGIQRTDDDGLTYTSLNELPVRKADGSDFLNTKQQPANLKELAGSNTYYDLKFDTSQKDGLIYASGYGIFRLINGEYWQEIEVLNKPREIKIYATALDGVEGKSLYFATVGKFYRSDNGGKDWTVKQMPATGIPKQLALIPGSIDQLFIAFYAPPKK